MDFAHFLSHSPYKAIRKGYLKDNYLNHKKNELETLCLLQTIPQHQRRRARADGEAGQTYHSGTYCLSKKSWPILPYKLGQNFLDIQLHDAIHN